MTAVLDGFLQVNVFIKIILGEQSLKDFKKNVKNSPLFSEKEVETCSATFTLARSGDHGFANARLGLPHSKLWFSGVTTEVFKSISWLHVQNLRSLNVR